MGGEGGKEGGGGGVKEGPARRRWLCCAREGVINRRWHDTRRHWP